MTNVDTSTSMESPLHHRVAHTNAANAGVVMKEDKFRGQLNLRGNPQDAAFTSAVEKVLGVALPMAPSSSVRNGDTVVYWLCPNEWLLIVASGTQGQVEADLRSAMDGQHIAVTDISSGQTLVNLSGTGVAELMQKSTVYDCHDSNFPVGKVVQTTFAKTGTTMCKLEDGSYDLVIRRSFSDYFFLWLQDASDEYGLSVS
ncbi:MAG: sarcosine oxidase subunit gamma [Oceanospirillaceae bacterium]|nr:sarcosine oxidase subunit gamma [Oceanospirillaceae bacterium]MBT4444143.1 sarcosine oxidase subunit gamma [Oceanospirillaceae bacterium]MBT6078219.1 sarcosine oxidase subunit gamma [Oceanospirillaceae bacterium]MBT7330276.1 sarcosine oxidase subunit gamma [Oceanospirillaceae bacterium]